MEERTLSKDEMALVVGGVEKQLRYTAKNPSPKLGSQSVASDSLARRTTIPSVGGLQVDLCPGTPPTRAPVASQEAYATAGS